MDKVLVLVGAYNGAKWIEEQVESILNQSGVDISVLVGDDLSSDGGVELLNKWTNDFDMEIIKYDVRSGGAGQNFFRLLKGVDLSRFDYVSFSDQDDIWLPEKTKKAIDVLGETRAVGYSAAVEAFWPNGKKIILGQNSKITDLDFIFEGAGQGCTFVIKKSFALEFQEFLGGTSVDLKKLHYHDWTIYALSRALGHEWFFDKQPALLYRQHGGNDTGARGVVSGIRKRLSLIRNGWYGGQVLAIFNVVISVNENAIPKDFRVIFLSRDSMLRRLSLARILFLRGRRRLSDRVILMVSSILGWI